MTTWKLTGRYLDGDRTMERTTRRVHWNGTTIWQRTAQNRQI